MFRHLQTLTIGILSCAAAAAAQSAPAKAATPDVHAIVQHMDEAARANRTHYRPYIVTRDYRMYGSDQQKPSSEVVAEVNFVPPGTKDFKILESKGSSRGEGVVRHVLESEQKAAAGQNAPGAVTSDNYNFAYLGEEKMDGRDCYVLQLTPKVKDKTVVEGKAWVDKDTYLIHKVEGDMSKLPSWWLKSVHVTLLFSAVDGMWMQTATRAQADVRIFGPHTFVSDTVNYRAGDTVAQNRGIKVRKKNTAADVLGASVIREP